MKILEVKDLSFSYKDGEKSRIILNKVNISFEKGKFYTILGESGSGKTTFLSLIGALEIPQTGVIKFQNKDINEIGINNYRRNNIAFVFQNYNLLKYMTALENVMLAMSISKGTSKIDKEEAYQKLDSVGIDKNKSNRLISKLSGGEQQRVAIARALSKGADIILADEPTGNLDVNTSEQIINIFKYLAHKQNKCVIVVTHSRNVSDVSDVVLKLDSNLHKFIIE